jgi:hypothetical protein
MTALSTSGIISFRGGAKDKMLLNFPPRKEEWPLKF